MAKDNKQMKVKFFRVGSNLTDLSSAINRFIADKKVVDIKYTANINLGCSNIVALVMYEEKKKRKKK